MRHKRILRLLTLVGLLWGVTVALSWAQWPQAVNFYSVNSTLDGDHVPVGTAVAAYDPTGVECGTSVFVTPGTFQLLPCQLDDKDTLQDEGANPGDVISFSIGGLPTTAVPISLNGHPVPPTASITWTNMADLWEVDLSACTLAGDLDCNCRVDVADIQHIAGQWGLAPGQHGYYPPYDHDRDGVDAADIQGIALGWRGTCASSD